MPVNEWALRELPARAATFLHVAGSHAPIRAALAAGGYGASEHAEGLGLLLATCARQTGGTSPLEDAAQRAAEAALNEWARTHFARLRAALERLHSNMPPLFSNPAPGDTASALLAVGTLLARLEELSRCKEGSPVLATLARRGLGVAERERLQQWVTTARQARTPEAAPETHDPSLLLLHDWYRDWSTTARSFIQRKDWLIRLGLLRRRTRMPLTES